MVSGRTDWKMSQNIHCFFLLLIVSVLFVLFFFCFHYTWNFLVDHKLRPCYFENHSVEPFLLHKELSSSGRKLTGINWMRGELILGCCSIIFISLLTYFSRFSILMCLGNFLLIQCACNFLRYIVFARYNTSRIVNLCNCLIFICPICSLHVKLFFLLMAIDSNFIQFMNRPLFSLLFSILSMYSCGFLSKSGTNDVSFAYGLFLGFYHQ